MNRSVELVSTGSELLNGRTVNRHAQTLGERLRPLGLALRRDTTVPDDADLIREAVESALRRAEVVVVTGGLGPTCDDVTRDAVARLLGRRVVVDSASLESLRERLRRAGRAVSPQAELQAQIVEGAVALPNRVGVAPGERLDLDGRTLFILPGPPDEFDAVLQEHVLPWLRHQVGDAGIPQERIFMVCGPGESDIMRRLDQAGFRPEAIEVGYSATAGRVEVRLSAPASRAGDLEASAAVVRAALGADVFAEERLDMEEVIGRLLSARAATLAVTESCSGGLLAHRITAVSGSSRYFLGGVVAYSNEAKQRLLGVSAESLGRWGAVSEAVAQEMALGVCRAFDAAFGLSVTGIAGPTGGTPEKPVGLVFVGLADAGGVWVRRHRFGGNRGRIKEWSSQAAMDLLRRRLSGLLGEPDASG